MIVCKQRRLTDSQLKCLVMRDDCFVRMICDFTAHELNQEKKLVGDFSPADQGFLFKLFQAPPTHVVPQWLLELHARSEKSTKDAIDD